MSFSDNIITNYGAVADGAWAAATLTIATNVLTSSTALWSVGDVGKSIVVGQAGGAGPQGGSPLLTTISAFTSATQITLGASAGQALSAEPNVIVAWGTNNFTAFSNFRTARAGDTGTLAIPASGTGVYLVSNADGNATALFAGVTNATVNMTGATIAGGLFSLGSGSQQATSGHMARTATVFAGSSFVMLSTPSQVSRFTVGQYAMMTGLSIQYGGYPSNHQRVEHCLVTAIDSNSGSPTYGKITFGAPLGNTYLSTWPLYDATAFDYGGPATLYAITANFNHTLIVNSGTFAHHSQFSVAGLSVTLNDCVFKGLYGPYPTVTKTSVYNRCTGLACNMEIDKYISDFSMTGCAWGTVQVQSTAPTLFTLDGTMITFTLLGTSYKTIIRNGCWIGTLAPSSQYGIANELNVSDSIVSNFGTVTFHASGHVIAGGDFSNNGVNIDFTMDNGVIAIPSSFYGYGLIEQWAVVGMQMFFYDANVGTIGSFTITGVTQDVSNVYVATTWTRGGFPSRTYGVNQLWLVTHPAPICTFSSVTGCPEVVDFSGAPVGIPLYSYSKRTYDNTTGAGIYSQLYGKIKYIKVTVTQLATQSGAVTLTLGNTCIKVSDFSNAAFAPTIDMKDAAGLNVPRILDARNAAFTGTWTGGRAGDSLPNLTEAIWACSNFKVSMTTITSGGGSAEVEYMTDQAFRPISVAPLRLGLHS